MRTLKIQNLILIEKAEIHFGPGLNILTGETGSGKSAILSAIRLIAGERAENSFLRNGAELAVVEAILEGPIFIRREIHKSGKNRCFIDDEQVSLAVLKETVDIEMVDQSSSHTIFEKQREMLDTFGDLVDEVREFERSVAEEREKKRELEEASQIPKERELEWARKDLELIEDVGWQRGEEEKLAEEHHFLIHAQEMCEKMGGVAFAMTEGGELSTLKRVLGTLEYCVRFDRKISLMAAAMKSVILELEEVGSLVQSYSVKLEADPGQLAMVEKRMGTIESLKRKFGTDIEKQKGRLIETIERLTNLDAQIVLLREAVTRLKEKNGAWARAITEKRRKAAVPFAAQVLDGLKSLNIPHAKFEIRVDEEVLFLFSANPGMAPIPVKECASGGELSRLLLAVKTVLSDGNSTLVFDEIDSNVGGQTAAILGQKIKRLAEKRQVICVTHFVQVAKCAIDHFLVSKSTKGGGAYTTIVKLSEKERESEYHRMLGHKNLSK